jgi:hypothetical protein
MDTLAWTTVGACPVRAESVILTGMSEESQTEWVGARDADSLPENQSELQNGTALQNSAHPDASVSRGGGWRRWRWPLPLFFLTCASTFWVGVLSWQPMRAFALSPMTSTLELRQLVLENWMQGVVYMLSVVGILLFHEMGHYVGTLIYKVKATPPFFLPFPFNPIGTLGAVIAMDGHEANRKQIFDIGIAGPLAGLVLAIPIAIVGVSQLDLSPIATGEIGFRMPLLLDWMIRWYEIPGYNGQAIWLSQLNPCFTAAWVGMLITGLNMMPVGQLDGGHVTYTLFGKVAHRIAELIMIFAVAYMVYWQTYTLVIMVTLLFLVGTEHPPTSNDRVPLGPVRWALGLASLSIPFLCFPPMIFDFRS